MDVITSAIVTSIHHSMIANVRIVYEALNLRAYPFLMAAIPPPYSLTYLLADETDTPSLPLAGKDPGILIGQLFFVDIAIGIEFF